MQPKTRCDVNASNFVGNWFRRALPSLGWKSGWGYSKSAGQGCQSCRRLSSLHGRLPPNQPVVVGMSADPHPDEVVSVLNGESTV